MARTHRASMQTVKKEPNSLPSNNQPTGRKRDFAETRAAPNKKEKEQVTSDQKLDFSPPPSPSSKKTKQPSGNKISRLKDILKEMLNELIVFTALQKSVLRGILKEGKKIDTRLKHFENRWGMLKYRLDELSSEDDLSISSDD